MTTQRDSFLQALGEIRQSIGAVLEGMDYCLDWKPDEQEWSIREVLYHLLDPSQGRTPAALRGILQGTLPELTIIAGQSNLTPEKESADLDALRQEMEAWFNSLEEALASANDSLFSERRITVHLPDRSLTTELTAQQMVGDHFLGHWREHIAQLKNLREQLGLD